LAFSCLLVPIAPLPDDWREACMLWSKGQEIEHYVMSQDLRRQIKELIVKELNLEGRDPTAIQDDAPLFGAAEAGLGLDSLDALQLAMSVEEHFGVRIPEGDEARPIFRSVAALAEHVAQHMPQR
jgi:acyl carrier protein